MLPKNILFFHNLPQFSCGKLCLVKKLKIKSEVCPPPDNLADFKYLLLFYYLKKIQNKQCSGCG